MGPSKKYVIVTVAILVIAVLIGFYYMNYKRGIDNKAALAELNGEIYKYGSNLHYLLANQTMFNSTMGSGQYQNITLWTGNQSLQNLLVFFHNSSQIQNKTLSNLASNADLLSYDPSLRLLTAETLYSLGLPVLKNWSGTTQPSTLDYTIPVKVPNAVSLYELKGTSTFILFTAEELSSLFKQGLFTSNANSSQNTIPGVSVYSNPYWAGTLGTDTLTGFVNNSYAAEDLSTVFPPGWLSLIFTINSYSGKGIGQIGAKQLYLLSLNEYYAYENGQILYNTTIPASINFIGYLNGTLLVNLGNLNLSNPQISLYVDGNKTNYSRYWNFILVPDMALAMGQHNLTVFIGGREISQQIYVSPNQPANVLYAHNYTGTDSSTLSFSIARYPFQNLSISNVSVSRWNGAGLNITPAGMWTISQSNGMEPITLLNYTYQNATGSMSLVAAAGGHYNLNSSANAIELLYRVGDVVQVGSISYFRVNYETSQGRAESILVAKAS